MATGPRYVVKFGRRREGKTDYPKRVRLLKSKQLRLVLRRSNKYISGQIVEFNIKGDKILAAAHSSELKEFGWKHGFSNTPAAYLTGLLLGKKIPASAGQKPVILDIGIYKMTKSNKLLAGLKGAADSGLKIKYGTKLIPSEDRIRGKHIAQHLKIDMGDFDSVKKRIMEIKK
ncbi:MAG: 50S ribosomal protein L18 [DPANN group archaeon]|nr:50S ribosomal protein L18 [DPANN group archaeon]